MLESGILEDWEYLSLRLFLIITDATTIAVYCILGFLTYIMIKVPLQSMGALRHFYFINIAISVIFETLLVSLKPLVLFPFAVLYPLGWLGPLNAITTLILATFALNCLAIFVDILISMLAQRYFYTRVMINKASTWLQYLFYSVLWGSNFGCCFFCSFILSHYSSDPDDIAALILREHPYGKELISRQPQLTGFIDYASPAIINFFRFVVFFALSRCFAICILTALNYRLLTKHSSMWTVKTQKMLRMFLKSICAKAGVLLIAGGCPGIVTIVLFIFPTLPSIQILWMTVLWCAFFFPFVQSIAIILFTPPFFKFVKKQWRVLSSFVFIRQVIIRINHRG